MKLKLDVTHNTIQLQEPNLPSTGQETIWHNFTSFTIVTTTFNKSTPEWKLSSRYTDHVFVPRSTSATSVKETTTLVVESLRRPSQDPDRLSYFSAPKFPTHAQTERGEEEWDDNRGAEEEEEGVVSAFAFLVDSQVIVLLDFPDLPLPTKADFLSKLKSIFLLLYWPTMIYKNWSEVKDRRKCDSCLFPESSAS